MNYQCIAVAVGRRQEFVHLVHAAARMTSCRYVRLRSRHSLSSPHLTSPHLTSPHLTSPPDPSWLFKPVVERYRVSDRSEGGVYRNIDNH